MIEKKFLFCLKPLYSGKPWTSAFAYSDDPDEMQY